MNKPDGYRYLRAMWRAFGRDPRRRKVVLKYEVRHGKAVCVGTVKNQHDGYEFIRRTRARIAELRRDRE